MHQVQVGPSSMSSLRWGDPTAVGSRGVSPDDKLDVQRHGDDAPQGLQCACSELGTLRTGDLYTTFELANNLL